MRFACLAVADFTIAVVRRHNPTLGNVPLVVGAVPPERGHIIGVSPEAHQAGVRRGMTSIQAEAILPGARFVAPDSNALDRAQRFLSELLHTLTPGVETRRDEDTVYFFLDTRGLGYFHATEVAFAERARTLLGDHGFPATVGIADSKRIARIAGRETDATGVRAIASGGDSEFLAPLPLERLLSADDAGLLSELHELGITTVAAWAAIDPIAIGNRFGPAGLALHAFAHGEDREPFAPTPDDDAIEVAIELDATCADLDLLTFHLKRATENLCRRLAANGLATARVRLTLDLDDHSRTVREASFPRPTIAPRLILDCLRLELGRETLVAPVRACLVAAIDVLPARAEQLQLFARQRAGADPATVEQALARVRALLGPAGVVSPRPADSHRPEAQIRWEPFAGIVSAAIDVTARSRRRRKKTDEEARLPRVHPAAELPPGPALRALPTRLLATPLALEVRLDRSQSPVAIAVGHLRGSVTEASGPHRLDGEWWADAYARDYFKVTLGDASRYWIYRDLRANSWFLHGAFD